MRLYYHFVSFKIHWLLILGLNAALTRSYNENSNLYLRANTHGKRNGVGDNLRILDKTKRNLDLAIHARTFQAADVAKVSKLAKYVARDARSLSMSLQKMRPLLHQYDKKYNNVHKEIIDTKLALLQKTSSRLHRSSWNVKSFDDPDSLEDTHAAKVAVLQETSSELNRSPWNEESFDDPVSPDDTDATNVALLQETSSRLHRSPWNVQSLDDPDSPDDTDATNVTNATTAERIDGQESYEPRKKDHHRWLISILVIIFVVVISLYFTGVIQ